MSTIARAITPHGDAEQMSDAEWETRVNLAALYRLAALHGWDDLIFTHISARVPGSEHHFLINPMGSAYDEITASSLVKIDVDGNIISPVGAQINGAGFIIHSAVHVAREDAMFVLHLHTRDGMAVAAHRHGLLPLNQMSMGIMARLAYHEYEGIVMDLGERERLAADLGNKSCMLLKHHGTLAIGPTAGSAWTNMYYLELACSLQVKATGGGIDHLDMVPASLQKLVGEQWDWIDQPGPTCDMIWDAMLRKVRRSSPGFDS